MSSSSLVTSASSDRDHLHRIAYALVYAASVFGGADQAAQWLKKRNEALGGAIPRHLLATTEGEMIVRAELGAFDHGLPV